MFYDYIGADFPLADGNIFPNIKQTGLPDFSYPVTLKALLHERITDDEEVEVVNGSTAPAAEILEDISNKSDKKTDIIVMRSSVFNAEYLEVLKKNGFEEVSDIQVFIKEQTKNEVFLLVNKGTKTVIMGMDIDNMAIYHLLQAFTTRLLPWYFNDDNPLKESEREFVKTLMQKDSAEYRKAVEKIEASPIIQELKIGHSIISVIRGSMNRKIETRKSELNRIERSISSNLQEYRSLVLSRTKAQEELWGAQWRQDHVDESQVDELKAFFRAHKKIEIVNVEGTTLRIKIKDTLDGYDPDLVSRRIADFDNMDRENPLRDHYRVENQKYATRDSRKKFMGIIFSDSPRFSIKMESHYQLDINGYVEVNDIGAYDENRIPNPHLHRHHCLGEYKNIINKALLDGELVTAIENCCFSAKSVNLGENATVCYLWEWLFSNQYSNKKVIVDNETGEELTPNEFYDQYIYEKPEETDDNLEEINGEDE